LKLLKTIAKRALSPNAYHAIERWRVRWHVAKFQPYVIKTNVGGCERFVKIADSLAQGWYDRSIDIPPEFELLRRGKLREGAVVFDLGAHQGVVAMILAREVGETGTVIAVEANEHNARIASENFSLNGLSNIAIIRAAAGENHGADLSFSETLNGSVDAALNAPRVPEVSIDGLAAVHGSPDVIYVDVEGYETQVLRGAAKTFAGIPDWYVEVHVGAGLEKFGSVTEVVEHFENAYELYIASNTQPFRPFSWGSQILKDRFYLVALAKARHN
jgi:FkbM family methyltransferase